jgi:AbrB family looped-hinge helix DNA binding protein
MPRSTLTSKGQITLPKAVREALAVHPGDTQSFLIHDDGTVTVEAETVDLLQLRGAVKPARRGVTVEEMNEAIRRSAART